MNATSTRPFVVGVFDDHAHAERAIRALLDAGLTTSRSASPCGTARAP